jgi:hypothetical protein
MINNIIGIPMALFTIKIIKDYSTIEPLLVELKSEDETTIYNSNYPKIGI